MFQTDDSWEHTSGLAVLRALFNQPGLRRHSVVEIPDNKSVLHVDVLFEGESADLGMWSRFMFTGTETFLEFLEVNDIACSKVTLQTCRVTGNDYAMLAVDEIRARQDSDGSQRFEFHCRDGSKIPDFPDSIPTVPLQTEVVVWSALAGHSLP